MEVAPGEVLLGKYRVDRLLGRGGFGYVVAATHLQLGERVAIKFLHAELAANPVVVARFLREAQAAARLKSHHVVRATDVGVLPGGAPYMVMEYLEGEDLQSRVRGQGPLPAATAAAWLLDACEAIAEAHALGIVHRDLKPANIFLARGPGLAPVIKVLDFGISKIATGVDVSLTRSSTILGSPMYAAPEQLRSTRDADARSDIWSLGVTLYHLVSGQVPFPGETVSEVCMKVAVDPVPSLSGVVGLPRGLERVIDTCLEKDPAKRYQDIGAFAAALAPFAGVPGAQSLGRVLDALGARAVEAPGKAPDARAPRATTLTGSAGEKQRARPGGHRGLAAATGAVVAVLTVAAIAFLTRSERPRLEPPPRQPPPAVPALAAPSSPDAATVATAYILDAGVAIAVPDAGARGVIGPLPLEPLPVEVKLLELEQPPPRPAHRRAKKPVEDELLKEKTLNPFEDAP